jgi:hypothetical protein
MARATYHDNQGRSPWWPPRPAPVADKALPKQCLVHLRYAEKLALH